MLELLLVKLEPFTYVGNEDKNIIGGSEFSVNISDDEPLEYEVIIKHYIAGNSSNSLWELWDDNNSAFIIDKFSGRYYSGGAVLDQKKSGGIVRYEVKCLNKDAPYDHIILICPNFEPIVLANLNFSYWRNAHKISETAQFFFDKDVTLSVETFFGDFRGINLIDYEKEDFPSSFYALRAKRIRCSDAVLSQFLQNGSGIDALEPVTEPSD